MNKPTIILWSFAFGMCVSVIHHSNVFILQSNEAEILQLIEGMRWIVELGNNQQHRMQTSKNNKIHSTNSFTHRQNSHRIPRSAETGLRACDWIESVSIGSKLFRFVNASIKFKSKRATTTTRWKWTAYRCVRRCYSDIDTKLNHSKLIRKHLRPPPPQKPQVREFLSSSHSPHLIPLNECVELCVMNYWMKHLTECLIEDLA